MSTPSGSGLGYLPVSISAGGANIVIPASAGGFFIRRLVLAASAQTSFQFLAGARQLSGPMWGTAIFMDFSEQIYYGCEPGEDFIITMGAPVDAGGTVWFQRGPV